MVQHSMRRRPIAAALVAFCALVSAAVAVASTTSHRASSPVVIGAALPLTGGFSAYAATWKNGVVLAQNEINTSGGIAGRRLSLPIEDWGSDTAKSVQVFTDLATVKHASAIIGGGSGAILAQAPLSDRYNVPLVNAAAQTPAMRGAAHYLFSDINDASAEAADLVRYMVKQLHITRAIIYYVDDATGQGQRDALTASCKKYGVTIIDTLSHSFTDTNYRTVIAKMKSENPPAVLVGSHWENTGYTLKQSVELGFKPTWLTLSPAWSDVTLGIAGAPASEGLYTIRSSFDLGQGAKAHAFISHYTKRFGSAPDVYAAHFYDAVYLIKAAILRAGGKTDGTSIMKAIHTFNGHGDKNRFFGVSGAIAFDSQGMTRQPNYILRIHNGKMVLVTKKTVS